MRQQLGGEVGSVELVINHNTPGASSGLAIETFPEGTWIVAGARDSSLSGGSSPGVSIGSTATGTEFLASGTTNSFVGKKTAAQTTVYAALTGSPTGGSIKVLVLYCLPRQ